MPMNSVGFLNDFVDTPALLINEPVLQKNLKTMAAYCKNTGIALRPHTKTHKCPEIARRQLDLGAIGLVCAKLGEAEAMAEAGLGPLLVANQVIGPLKMKRLLKLNDQVDISVCVGRVEHVEELIRTAEGANTILSVFIELEVGMQRCGAAGPVVALDLAKKISDAPRLEFRGVMGYEGHAVGTKDLVARHHKAETAHHELALAVAMIRENGIEVPVVSAAGTGTFNLGVDRDELTEIQPGSYCLMDSDYHGYENVCDHFELACTVLATVIDQVDRRIVLDVGLKSIATDQGLPVTRWREDIIPFEIHEEHYCMEVGEDNPVPRVGDRLELLPSHICATANLYDEFHVFREQSLIARWPITGRGRYT